MVKILVTGDVGKLGSLARAQLEGQGDEVVGFDIRRDPREDIVPGDNVLLERMEGCQVVLHCAAIPHPGVGSFGDYLETNVIGTFNVARAARKAGVKRLVYFSSTAYYGCNIDGKLYPGYFPIDEGHPVASIEGYSEGKLDEYNQSKVLAEQILAYFGTNRTIEVVVLRCAPANTKADQYRAGFDWRTDDTYRRGCFFVNCHPEYAVEAAVLALKAEGPFWYEAFILTDRFTHESIDLQEFLEQEYPEVELRAPIGRDLSLVSPTKAQRVLGWRPCEERA